MARPCPLTDGLRVDIGRRIAAGESIRALSREYKIPESTLRSNFSAQAPQIREVAQSLATAELCLAALPVTAQRSARTLADQLKMVEEHYAHTAELGADTAHRLAGIANRKARALGDDVESEDLRTIAALSDVVVRSLNPATQMIAVKPKEAVTTVAGLEQLLAESWGPK